jgi:hypothetical protein
MTDADLIEYEKALETFDKLRRPSMLADILRKLITEVRDLKSHRDKEFYDFLVEIQATGCTRFAGQIPRFCKTDGSEYMCPSCRAVQKMNSIQPPKRTTVEAKQTCEGGLGTDALGKCLACGKSVRNTASKSALWDPLNPFQTKEPL